LHFHTAGSGRVMGQTIDNFGGSGRVAGKTYGVGLDAGPKK